MLDKKLFTIISNYSNINIVNKDDSVKIICDEIKKKLINNG